MADESPPTSGYSTSDKLGIALACLGGALALVLFIIEKTIWSVGLCLAGIAGFLVFPVLHFFKKLSGRIWASAILTVALILFGIATWPHKPPTVESRNGTTDQSKTEVGKAPPMTPSPTTTSNRNPKHRSRPNPDVNMPLSTHTPRDEKAIIGTSHARFEIYPTSRRVVISVSLKNYGQASTSVDVSGEAYIAEKKIPGYHIGAFTMDLAPSQEQYWNGTFDLDSSDYASFQAGKMGVRLMGKYSITPNGPLAQFLFEGALYPSAADVIATLKSETIVLGNPESTPSIQQRGQNNIAQIGNNNQATINPEPPERHWVITDEICRKLLTPIRTNGKLDVSLAHFMSDSDGANVANQLSRCLPNIRDWHISVAVVPPVPAGVTVTTSEENKEVAATLESGLNAIGFNATMKIIPKAPDVEIWVGQHAFKQQTQP